MCYSTLAETRPSLSSKRNCGGGCRAGGGKTDHVRDEEQRRRRLGCVLDGGHLESSGGDGADHLPAVHPQARSHSCSEPVSQPSSMPAMPTTVVGERDSLFEYLGEPP